VRVRTQAEVAASAFPTDVTDPFTFPRGFESWARRSAPMRTGSVILHVVSDAPPGQSQATRQLAELAQDECIRLLALTRFGRLAVSPPDWRTPPIIRPITYVFDRSSQSIVFRSARGSKFTALLLSGQAAFEIDGTDPEAETGWSVIVQGPIEEIINTAELHRLERLELRPWAPGDKPHWIRIRANVVSGRRIAP
jgi:nitroimidazol reductase NimA-like FMN-containing flavoprotein (pyridoxamine 5'-phosphate oxidase superfamily)